jgi:hypothetical protein
MVGHRESLGCYGGIQVGEAVVMLQMKIVKFK